MSHPPYQDLSRSIEGKTALITGAASGMGRATAHLFARQGANVAVTDLKQENVDVVVQEIRDAGFANVRAGRWTSATRTRSSASWTRRPRISAGWKFS